MKRSVLHASLWLVLIAALSLPSCSRGPKRIKPPYIDPESAASEAMSLYDKNGDGVLDQDELISCPGILSTLGAYDQDQSGTVSEQEIAERITQRRARRVGLQNTTAQIRLNGEPLKGAKVTFEPEPYLGGEVKAAYGTTVGGGNASMAIPSDQLPKHHRRLNAIHVGTYKVLVTHPEVDIPARYNTETELGFETESGQSSVRFELTLKQR